MSEDRRQIVAMPPLQSGARDRLPAAWLEFIRYCRDLRYGEVERLIIQDGVPVMAEMVTKKIKFDRG